jgi:hypothetical protein
VEEEEWVMVEAVAWAEEECVWEAVEGWAAEEAEVCWVWAVVEEVTVGVGGGVRVTG